MNHGIVFIANEESHFKMNILFKINIKKKVYKMI